MIYVYQYFVITADNEGAVSVIYNAGTMENQQAFFDKLLNDDNVVKAYREYVHEVDVKKLKKIDFIKGHEVNEDEKNES